MGGKTHTPLRCTAEHVGSSNARLPTHRAGMWAPACASLPRIAAVALHLGTDPCCAGPGGRQCRPPGTVWSGRRCVRRRLGHLSQPDSSVWAAEAGNKTCELTRSSEADCTVRSSEPCSAHGLRRARQAVQHHNEVGVHLFIDFGIETGWMNRSVVPFLAAAP